MNEIVSYESLPEAIRLAEDLPSLPAVAVEVLTLCRDEDTTLADLAEAIANDAALSARLMRFANSSLYNLGHEVSTLERAALVLGLKTVQLMALSFSLASSLPRSSDAHVFDYTTYWRRSMAGAVAGRGLASLVDPRLADEAFLCGLMGEIGQIVLVQCMSDEYEEVLSKSGDAWPTLEQERETLGVDRTDVAGALLRSWELPELIWRTVGAKGEVEPEGNDSPTSLDLQALGRLMRIGRLTVDLLTGGDRPAKLAEIESRAQEYFGLESDDVDAYVRSLELGIRETSEMLSVPLPPGLSHEDILKEAREQFVERSMENARELQDVRSTRDLEHRSKLLEDPRLTDLLTGIANREAFERFLEHEVGARLAGVLTRPLGLLALEIDRLDNVRDLFGQDIADEVLRLVGQNLRRLTRKVDLPARLSGRAFVVIMAECSPFGMSTLAERLRAGIESSILDVDGTPVGVTATIGGACLASVAKRSDGKALFEVAVRCLKKAKSAGTNRIDLHARPIHPPR